MKEYPESLITAFLTSCKASEIQQTAKISKTKYYRLKSDPEFQRILTERRTELIKSAVLTMESYLSKDVKILQGIIEDPDTSAQIKINGIQLMLNQLASWKSTTEILERIQNLERRYEEENN